MSSCLYLWLQTVILCTNHRRLMNISQKPLAPCPKRFRNNFSRLRQYDVKSHHKPSSKIYRTLQILCHKPICHIWYTDISINHRTSISLTWLFLRNSWRTYRPVLQYSSPVLRPQVHGLCLGLRHRFEELGLELGTQILRTRPETMYLGVLKNKIPKLTSALQQGALYSLWWLHCTGYR